MPKSTKPLFVFENEDKGYHEKTDHSDYVNLPHPFAMILCSKPGGGKTSVMKNIIARQRPHFERIIVWHVNPDSTDEYSEDDGVEMIKEIIPHDLIPEEGGIDKNMKNLLIIEDVKLGNHLSRGERMIINRYFGYMRTHSNISIMLTTQNFCDVPNDIRQMCNCYCIWDPKNMIQTRVIAERLGIKKESLKHIFDNVMKSKYDFLSACFFSDCTRYSMNFIDDVGHLA